MSLKYIYISTFIALLQKVISLQLAAVNKQVKFIHTCEHIPCLALFTIAKTNFLHFTCLSVRNVFNHFAHTLFLACACFCAIITHYLFRYLDCLLSLQPLHVDVFLQSLSFADCHSLFRIFCASSTHLYISVMYSYSYMNISLSTPFLFIYLRFAFFDSYLNAYLVVDL